MLCLFVHVCVRVLCCAIEWGFVLSSDDKSLCLAMSVKYDKFHFVCVRRRETECECEPVSVLRVIINRLSCEGHTCTAGD